LKHEGCSESHPLTEDTSSLAASLHFIGQTISIIAAYMKDKRGKRALDGDLGMAGIKGEMGSGVEISDPNLGHRKALYLSVVLCSGLGGRVDI